MKATISAKTFNGSSIQSKINLYIESFRLNVPNPQTPSLLSTNAQSSIRQIILDYLRSLYPQQNLESIEYNLISRDLEEMRKLKIKANSDSLVQAVVKAIKAYIAAELHFTGEDESELESFLRNHENAFCQRFCPPVETIALHPALQKARELMKAKQYPSAFAEISSVDSSELNEKDKAEVDFISFSIRLKMETADSETLNTIFEQYLADYANKPTFAKRFYFEYIRFLENVRDVHKPRKLIRHFREKYPLSILNSDELTLYYHLQGRAEYLRGEYLQALDSFHLALEHLDANDLDMRAAIFNSSVNAFTDNLFFEEALWIAEKAREIRSARELPESLESLSCIAGIKTKSNQHQEAYQILQEILPQTDKLTLTNLEINRFYNNLAKSAIFCGNYSEAGNYLTKAEAAGDRKGFSRMLRLLLWKMQQKYGEMRELFQSSLMLPENHDPGSGYDMFVLGWGYCFMAEAAFARQQFQDGALYLISALDFFLSDQYYLEARLVSLYGYAYARDSEYLQIICNSIDKMQIDALFEEYVLKHSSLRDKYFPAYHLAAETLSGASNLANLAMRIQELSEQDFPATALQELIHQYCLI